MNTPTNNYHSDFHQWSLDQAEFIKTKQFDQLDIENISEEIESLARSDKRAIKSQLERLLHHLLKEIYTPELKGNSNSWLGSIRTAREHINDLLEESPSLEKEFINLIPKIYEKSLQLAIQDSNYKKHAFPKECPWSKEEILGDIFE